MKRFLIIILIYFSYFNFSAGNVNETLNENLEKEFVEYKKNIAGIIKKVENLKSNDLNEVKIIDQSLKELKTLVSFVEDNLLLDKKDNLLNSLIVIDKYLGDISKIVPSEFSRQTSKEEDENIDEKTLEVMMSLSSSMKSKKTKKNSEVIISMNKLEKNGLNVYTINQKLIDLEVSSIGLDEISAVINPQNAVLNEDERKETIDNLKEGGGKSNDDLVKIIDI